MIITLILVCGLILLPQVVAIVYIDPDYTGDNGPENGSIASPYTSWSNFSIQSGETYLQKRGTTATINQISYRSNNVIGAYGSGSRPIINSSSSSYTIAPVGDYEENITIRDIEINNNIRNSASIRFLRNFTNVTVDNCVLHGGGAGISASYGNKTFFPKNITFINNIVYNVSEDGFLIQGITGFSNVSNNYIYQINRDWFEEGQTEVQAPGDGVHIIGHNESSGFFYISNNTVDRTDTANKFCIITVGFYFSAIIERNICYTNPFLVEQTAVQGYYLSDISNSNYMLFRYNTCFNCSTGVITYVRNLTMYNNIFVDSGIGVNAVNNYDAGNVYIYNNLFYNSRSQDIAWWQSYVTIYNNIFYNNVSGHSELSGNGDHLVDSDYNLFNTAFSTGADTHSIQADPLFVDSENYNFYLTNDSPAIDQGLDVDILQDFNGTLIPQGIAPDIGVYEYIQSNYSENSSITGNLTVNYSLGGTAIGNYSNFELPANLDINATPQENYTFSDWSIISGDCEIDDSSLEDTTVTVNSGWCYIEANFNYSLTFDCSNITTSGIYSLSSNIYNDNTCFNISSSNITLDCAGFSITGSNSSGSYGVYITQSNVTIKNCNINNFSSGIFLTNTVSNSTLYNNVINQSFNSSCSISNGSCFGICLNGADYDHVFNNTIYLGRTLYGGGIGVYSSANYNNVSNNTIVGGYYNIYIHSSNGNNIIDNSLYNSWYDGMYIQSTAYNSMLQNNYILNSTGSGIEFIGNYNITITNNTITNSTLYGIRIHNSLNNVNRSDNISNNNILHSGFAGIIISNSNYINVYNNTISNSNSNNERGLWISNGTYNTITGNYIQTLYAGLIRGALMINLSSNYNNITSNIINSSATGSSEARGILLDGGSSNILINNTIFVGSSSNTESIYVGIISENNVFCLNNFTYNPYFYVNDINTTNYYNCTYAGKNQGNIWDNVIDESLNITGNISSSISGLYLGDFGSNYPYDSVNSLNKVSSGVVDYSPLTPYLTTEIIEYDFTGNLTVNYSLGGVAIGNSSDFELPLILNINATPNEYYIFSNWTNISGNCTITNSSEENTTVTINSGWCYLQANFVSLNLGEVATVYIDPNYSGINGLENGSIERPYISWYNFSLASNRVYLQKRNTMFTSDLSFGLVVTGVNNVTLGAYGVGFRPIFNSTSLNNSARAITFSGGSHNSIRDFEVTSETGTIVVPVHLGYGGTNLTIDNCKLHNAQWGIRVGYLGTSNISILNSEVYNTRDDGIYVDGITGYLIINNNSIHNVNQNWYYVGTSDSQASGDGIQLNVLRNLTFNIINNIIDRTDTGNKFCFIAGANTTSYYNGTYENNTCYVNRSINGGDDINCVYLHVANNSNENRTIIFRNNLFHGCGFGIYSYSNDLRLYHNKFINVSTGVFTISGYKTLAYNNLFYNNVYSDMNWSSTSSEMRLLNNIFYSNSSSYVSINGAATPIVSDYNLFYPRATTYWVNRDDNSLFNTDPMFVDSNGRDFSLQNGSLAIDAGTDVGLTRDFNGTLIPQGLAPDIGVYEYVQSNYSENITVLGNLTVNYSFGGIAIGNYSDFELPSILDINATPLENYTFGNWSVISGDCEITNITRENTTVNVNSGWCYVEAIFELIELPENFTNTAPIINAQSFSIAEDAVEDDYIGTVVANDSDENQTITYNITSGNTNDAFKINATTGELYVNNEDELNFENVRNYTLVITVWDDYITPESSSNNITINITDVNEGGGGGGGGNNNHDNNVTIVLLNETNNSSPQNNSTLNNFLPNVSPEIDNLTIEQQIEEPKSITNNINDNDSTSKRLLSISSISTKMGVGIIFIMLLAIIITVIFYPNNKLSISKKYEPAGTKVYGVSNSISQKPVSLFNLKNNESKYNNLTNSNLNNFNGLSNNNIPPNQLHNSVPLDTRKIIPASVYYNDVWIYVDKHLKNGIPLNKIISELRNSGWSEKDIFNIVSHITFNHK